MAKMPEDIPPPPPGLKGKEHVEDQQDHVAGATPVATGPGDSPQRRTKDTGRTFEQCRVPIHVWPALDLFGRCASSLLNTSRPPPIKPSPKHHLAHERATYQQQLQPSGPTPVPIVQNDISCVRSVGSARRLNLGSHALPPPQLVPAAARTRPGMVCSWPSRAALSVVASCVR